MNSSRTPLRFGRVARILPWFIAAGSFASAEGEKPAESKLGSSQVATTASAPLELQQIQVQIRETEALARKRELSDTEVAGLAIKYQELASKRREYAQSRRETRAQADKLQQTLMSLKTPEERRAAMEEHIAITRASKPESTKEGQ